MPACNCSEILPLYRNTHCGVAPDNLAAVGPYLIGLGPTDEIFTWIWENYWGDGWGIFCWSVASAAQLRTHFRRHLLARTTDGVRLVLLFYDPHVLLPCLPTCDMAQLRSFFGPVQQFALEDDDGGAVVTLRRGPGGLVRQTVQLVE